MLIGPERVKRRIPPHSGECGGLVGTPEHCLGSHVPHRKTGGGDRKAEQPQITLDA